MSAPPPYGYNQSPVAPGYPPQGGYPPQQGPPQHGLPYPAISQPPMHPSQAGPAYAPVPGPAPATVVIISGGCPVCRVGMMENDFTCCGIFLAICFFPLGIVCCYALRQKRCTSCGHTVG